MKAYHLVVIRTTGIYRVSSVYNHALSNQPYSNKTHTKDSKLSSSTNVRYSSSSSSIVRLGVDVLPTTSQAVVHNGIVYLTGQIDGTADDIKGQTKNVLNIS